MEEMVNIFIPDSATLVKIEILPQKVFFFTLNSPS